MTGQQGESAADDPEAYTSCYVCGEMRKKHDPATFVEYADVPDDGFDGPLSEHEIEALRARYTEPEIPPCRLCGALLSIASMGGGRPTIWRCSSPEADFIGEPGWDGPKRKHYSDSEFEQRRHGDSTILRLLDEVVTLRAGVSAVKSSSGGPNP